MEILVYLVHHFSASVIDVTAPKTDDLLPVHSNFVFPPPWQINKGKKKSG